MIKMEQTFVYTDVEVRKTGRIATKPLPGGKLLRLVEITPLNSNDGDWKKFVAETALLKIETEL